MGILSDMKKKLDEEARFLADAKKRTQNLIDAEKKSQKEIGEFLRKANEKKR